jgi:hypothetical protein
MKLFDETNISRICFPDIDVSRMEYKANDKILVMYITGAFIIDTREDLASGKIIFTDWEAIHNDKWEHDLKVWVPLNNPSGETLENVLRFECLHSVFNLEGMGKNIAEWIRWKIVKPKIKAEFDEFSFPVE